MKLQYRVGWPGWRLAVRAGLPASMRVQVHHDAESGTYWADSPDLDGLAVGGDTLDELRTGVIDCAEMLLEEACNSKPRHVTADIHVGAALCGV